MKPIEIRFNKLKVTLFLAICLVFVILCWNFLTNPEQYISYRYRSSYFICVAGFFGILLFGSGFIYFIKILLYRKPALIIDEKGIEEYTTIMSVGLISWEDITSIKEIKVNSNLFFTICIKNEKKYLALSKSKLQTYMMKMNSKHYRSPFQISTTFLNCKKNKLREIIFNAYATYKK